MRILVAIAVLLASPRAAAGDDRPPAENLRVGEPAIICTLAQPERCRVVRPGRFVDEDRWSALDAELRRAQGQETRLAAENALMRKRVESWQPGWKSIAVAVIVGLGAGSYAYHKIAE